VVSFFPPLRPGLLCRPSLPLWHSSSPARRQESASFGAAAGTYEIKGDTLVTRNDVAKMVRGVGLVEQAIVKLQGNTFTAQPKPGEPKAGRATTYTRVRAVVPSRTPAP
jgi:hypothetical protein